MFKLILLATVVTMAVAGGGKNKCPWVIGKHPFDEVKIAGEWYAISVLKDKSFTCGKYNYQVTKDAHVIGFSGKKEDGSVFRGESYGQPIFGKSEKASNMLAVWKHENGTYTDVFMHTTVLSDYDNYAVYIACRNTFDDTNKSFGRELTAGILSRKPTLSSETVQVLKNVLSGYDIDVSAMKDIAQNNC